MLALLIIYANVITSKESTPESYKHIAYVSMISPEDCFICNGHNNPLTSPYWNQDNVAILDMNTFEFLRLEINRYGDHGESVTTEAGYIQSCGMKTKAGRVHGYVYPDRGYANVQISGVEYNIERDSIESNLCQTCLDSVNDVYYSDHAPAELAVFSFSEKTLRPLTPSTTGFWIGSFYVDCVFKDENEIDLLIFYSPHRYR